MGRNNKEEIPNYELTFGKQPVSFVIDTMEEIDRMNEGKPDRPHRHNFYTVLWPFTAKGTHYIDFKAYDLAPDHLFFVSPGQVHQVVTDPKPTGIVIMFTPEFLQLNGIREDFIADLNLFRPCGENPPLEISAATKPKLQELAVQMQENFGSDSPYRYEALGAYLKLFLIHCRQECTLEPEQEQEQFSKAHVVRIFKENVEKHFYQWHKVAQYADAMHITPNYLNEVIKSSIGKTAKEYIQNRQILEAKRLIVFTHMTVKEVAFSLGFEDPSYFNKFFRRFTDHSLLEFRNEHA